MPAVVDRSLFAKDRQTGTIEIAQSARAVHAYDDHDKPCPLARVWDAPCIFGDDSTPVTTIQSGDNKDHILPDAQTLSSAYVSVLLLQLLPAACNRPLTACSRH